MFPKCPAGHFVIFFSFCLVPTMFNQGDTMKKQVKNWANVYVLRQEYNVYAKKWFPVILYWNRSLDRQHVWVEGLFTETGRSFYYDEIKADYTSITKPGTNKCDPEKVKEMVERYVSDFKHDLEDPSAFDGNDTPIEVKKLAAYRPNNI